MNSRYYSEIGQTLFGTLICAKTCVLNEYGTVSPWNGHHLGLKPVEKPGILKHKEVAVYIDGKPANPQLTPADHKRLYPIVKQVFDKLAPQYHPLEDKEVKRALFMEN